MAAARRGALCVPMCRSDGERGLVLYHYPTEPSSPRPTPLGKAAGRYVWIAGEVGAGV